MPFDPLHDKIAITVPRFTLKKHADGVFQRYNEPSIVSVAMDAAGDGSPRVDFNFMPFPKVAGGGTVTLLGDGHLVYGPKQPGEFVVLSVLIMEHDGSTRELGTWIEEWVHAEAVELGLKALVAAHPGHAAALAVLKELTQRIAGRLKQNRDDELFRTEGAFLRDHAVPYHVNSAYEIGNEFVSLTLSILPLREAGREGPRPRTILLEDRP